MAIPLEQTLAQDQYVKNHPSGENVANAAVGCGFVHQVGYFRGHETWRPAFWVEVWCLILDRGEPEVGYSQGAQVASLQEEHVFGLEVPMHYVFRVHVVQSLQDLAHNLYGRR